jgi:hypothetical protein
MKCFVISPIGQPNTPAREHADDVYECVIKPALELTGVAGRRADHVKDVGRISEQMFDDILTADFCIGVLAGFNPNVFYEIAVAHSAGIPVILLCEPGVVPPFDLKDERAFHYDLSPRPILRGDNPKALAELIESVRKLDGRRRVPFGDALAPLGGKGPGAGGLQVNPETTASAGALKTLIGGAKTRFYVSAIGLTGWKGIPGLRESLSALAARGCEIRVLTMDAENPALPMMTNPGISSDAAGSLGGKIDSSRDWLRELFKDNPKAAVRTIRSGSATQHLIVADDAILWSPYLYSVNTRHAPRIEIDKTSPLFDVFLQEFQALWDANAG